jgi:hypothetical protein
MLGETPRTTQPTGNPMISSNENLDLLLSGEQSERINNMINKEIYNE